MAKLITTVSDKFIPCLLDPEERDVLTAYRCPAGVWTISRGLTAASGVIRPVKGMVITADESLRLTNLAINRNYAPRVAKHLPTTKQHVFDGATSFDWNTGRIHNASWVKLFKDGRFEAAAKSFMQWVRGGGKVLPGLEKRRKREWGLILHGIYPTAEVASTAGLTTYADHAADFALLGYDASKIAASHVELIKLFQLEHGLRSDGLIGPATRAALRRAVEAKRGNQLAAAGGVGTSAVSGSGELAQAGDLASVPIDSLVFALSFGALAAGLIIGASLIWRNRGPLFAWLPEPVKDATASVGIVVGRRVPT